MKVTDLVRYADTVIDTACERHIVDRVALLRKVPRRKTGPYVRARYEIASELRREGLSLPVIGAILGNMHHTAVMLILRRQAPVAEPA